MENDFKLLCNRIERCYKRERCNANPVVCATYFIKKYVAGDRNKLLKIKAESNEILYDGFIQSIFSILAVAVSTMSLILTIINQMNGNKELLKLIQFKNNGEITVKFNEFTNVISYSTLIAIIIIFIITALNQRKARNMRKWQKYFIVSIEELERSREY